MSIFFQTLVDPEGAKADRWARGGGATGGGGGGKKKIRGMKDTQGANDCGPAGG